MYYEVNSQAQENALTLANGDIVVRLDLLPQPPPPPPPVGQPVVAYTLMPETNLGVGYLTVADNNNLDFGTGDFEIVFDFKLANLPQSGVHQTFFSKGSTLNNAWYLMLDSSSKLSLTTSNNNAAIYVASGLTDTTTYHNLKVKRVAGVTTLYLDGVSKGTTSLPLIDTAAPMYVGAWNYQLPNHRFLGLMKNAIITKG